MYEEQRYHQLKRIKTGSRRDFRHMYERYHKLIYFYCLKIIRQNAWAEEATADVFVTLWTKRHIIDPRAPFTPLLYKIAKDIAYNYLKKIALNEHLKQAFVNSITSLHSYDGETILIEKESLDAIHVAVEKMPPRRKEIFKLRYFEGLNNKAIAQQLNISSNTVREHLARARQVLRESYDLFL